MSFKLRDGEHETEYTVEYIPDLVTSNESH